MPYDHPFRLRVLDALTDCLKQITIANGYKTDLGGHVYRGRSLYGPSDPVPMLSILETPVPIDQVLSPEMAVESTGDWDLLIQGFVQDDPDNPTDPGHILMADVKKALANERKRVKDRTVPDILGMAGQVIRLEIGPGTVRPPDGEVSILAYFWLRVTLKIVEDNFDPYV